MVKNNKGMGMIGVLIAAVIGLIVIVGISKAIINFSSQSMRTVRSNQTARFKENMVQRLGDIDIWKKSKELAGKKIPGETANIKLYNADGSGPWACRRKGGSRSQGIAALDQAGNTVNLNCGQCASSRYCGLSPKEYSFVLIDATTKGELVPSYALELQDTAGGKTSQKFEALSANEKLYDEKQLHCKADEFLRMVVDGKPVCEKQHVLLWNKQCQNDWEYLYGFDTNGDPLCEDVRPYINSEIDRFNTRVVEPSVRDVNNRRVAAGSYVSKNIRNIGFTTKYKKVYGRNDSECAKRNIMQCPKGYMMIAYEARQATMGNNCSIQCRKIVTRLK